MAGASKRYLLFLRAATTVGRLKGGFIGRRPTFTVVCSRESLCQCRVKGLVLCSLRQEDESRAWCGDRDGTTCRRISQTLPITARLWESSPVVGTQVTVTVLTFPCSRPSLMNWPPSVCPAQVILNFSLTLGADKYRTVTVVGWYPPRHSSPQCGHNW